MSPRLKKELKIQGKCIACRGSGISSSGNSCVPCKGTGVKQLPNLKTPGRKKKSSSRRVR